MSYIDQTGTPYYMNIGSGSGGFVSGSAAYYKACDREKILNYLKGYDAIKINKSKFLKLCGTMIFPTIFTTLANSTSIVTLSFILNSKKAPAGTGLFFSSMALVLAGWTYGYCKSVYNKAIVEIKYDHLLEKGIIKESDTLDEIYKKLDTFYENFKKLESESITKKMLKYRDGFEKSEKSKPYKDKKI